MIKITVRLPSVAERSCIVTKIDAPLADALALTDDHEMEVAE